MAQTGLKAAARRRNLRQAFSVSGSQLPSHVLLIDDVMTTGATLEAMSTVLKSSGVTHIDVWVCARTLQ